MYKINTANGDIHRQDGFVITAPYDEPEYLEYAAWVQAGNSPEEIYIQPSVPVPESVSRFQARAALYTAGYLEAIEQVMQDLGTPMLSKLAWQDALEFRRDSALVASMGALLSLSEVQIDDLFRLAATITA